MEIPLIYWKSRCFSSILMGNELKVQEKEGLFHKKGSKAQNRVFFTRFLKDP
jgi:hypothetical protein